MPADLTYLERLIQNLGLMEWRDFDGVERTGGLVRMHSSTLLPKACLLLVGAIRDYESTVNGTIVAFPNPIRENEHTPI